MTVLIHDQQCAAEKRRDRKRGRLPRPGFKLMIDERVCEGCGDCGVKSNCLSLQPIDTEFGRKTTIDQASCNLDVSCLKGDCPAFITVKLAKGGARRRRPGGELDGADAPGAEPHRPRRAPRSACRASAARASSRSARCWPRRPRWTAWTPTRSTRPGLSQKAGPVVSTVSIGEHEPGRIDVLIGFDLLASVTPANLAGLEAGSSVVVASTTITPTGRMVGRVATAELDPTPLVTELDARGPAASSTPTWMRRA